MAAVLIALAITTTGCQSRSVDLTGFDPDAPPSFAADVAPIFRSNCAPCHIGTRTSGVELTTHASTLTSVGSQYATSIIVAGDAEASPLLDKIASAVPQHGLRMPDSRPPLSNAQIELIRGWIDEGAPDN